MLTQQSYFYKLNIVIGDTITLHDKTLVNTFMVDH